MVLFFIFFFINFCELSPIFKQIENALEEDFFSNKNPCEGFGNIGIELGGGANGTVYDCGGNFVVKDHVNSNPPSTAKLDYAKGCNMMQYYHKKGRYIVYEKAVKLKSGDIDQACWTGLRDQLQCLHNAGYCHGDPHSGNVMKSAVDGRCLFIDFDRFNARVKCTTGSILYGSRMAMGKNYREYIKDSLGVGYGADFSNDEAWSYEKTLLFNTLCNIKNARTRHIDAVPADTANIGTGCGSLLANDNIPDRNDFYILEETKCIDSCKSCDLTTLMGSFKSYKWSDFTSDEQAIIREGVTTTLYNFISDSGKSTQTVTEILSGDGTKEYCTDLCGDPILQYIVRKQCNNNQAFTT